MKIENIDIEATIEKAQDLVRQDKQLSVVTKSMFEILILIFTLPAKRLNLISPTAASPHPVIQTGRRKRKGIAIPFPKLILPNQIK